MTLPGLSLSGRMPLLPLFSTWPISTVPSDLSLNIASVRLSSLSLPCPPPRISQPSLRRACCLCSKHSVFIGKQMCHRCSLFLTQCRILCGIESFLTHLLRRESQKITDDEFPYLRPGQWCEASEQNLSEFSTCSNTALCHHRVGHF